MDCDNFPEGASIKVKEKMSTSNVRHVTCETCKARILGALSVMDWRALSQTEVDALDLVSALITSPKEKHSRS